MAGFFTGFATGALNAANQGFAEQRKLEDKKDLYYTELYTKTQAELAKSEADNAEKAKQLKQAVINTKNAYGLPDDDTATILVSRSLDSKGEIDPKLLSQNAYEYSQKRLNITRTGDVPTPAQGQATNPYMQEPNQAALQMFPEKWRNKNMPNQGKDFAQQYSRAFAKPQLPSLTGTYDVKQTPSVEEQNVTDTIRHRGVTEQQQNTQLDISKQNATTAAKQAATSAGQLKRGEEAENRYSKEQGLRYENSLLDQVHKGLDPEEAENRWKQNFPDIPSPNFKAQKQKAEVDKRASHVMGLIRQVGAGTLTTEEAENNWRVMTGAKPEQTSGIDWGKAGDSKSTLEKNITFLKTIPEYSKKSQAELYEMARGFTVGPAGQVISQATGSVQRTVAPAELIKKVNDELYTYSKIGPQVDRYVSVIQDNPNFINLQQRLASVQNIAEVLNAPEVGQMIANITLDAAKSQEVEIASRQLAGVARQILSADTTGRLTADERMNADKALGMYSNATDARQRLVAAAYLRTTLDMYVKRGVEFLQENGDSRMMAPKFEKTKESLEARIGWWMKQGVSPANAREFTREEFYKQGQQQ